jgi:predicted flavoprotein YhiN
MRANYKLLLINLVLALAVFALPLTNWAADPNLLQDLQNRINDRGEKIKAVPLTVVGRRPGDEFVTAGGINLSEIDAKTLESKICPRLYFAGELIDVDGFTGGFNLQASWATGRAAGVSIASL